MRLGGVAVALGAALCVSPVSAAPDRVTHGDDAGFVAAMSALGFGCKSSDSGETSCLFRGNDGGMMAVTMDASGMFSLLFAGRAMESDAIAEAYRAMAPRLAFGAGDLAARFAEPSVVASFCPQVGHVGTGKDAGWCDATLVFSADGGEIVQNVTRQVKETLGMGDSVDRESINAAVWRAAIDPGVYVVMRSSENAPSMTGLSWITIEGIPQDAE